MKYAELINESLEQLETLRKKQRLVRDEKRMRFLIYLKSGQSKSQKAAGERVGWKLRQSQNVWRLYRERGINGLLARQDRRGFGKLSSVQIGQLNRYLEEFGACSLAEMQKYLRETCGVEYTIGGLSDLCIRLKIKLKTVRPSNYRKDEAAVAEYKKTFAA